MTDGGTARAMMANPELRHPFERTDIHPTGHTTVLYQGHSITLPYSSPVSDALLIKGADLERINGFEVKPQGACLGDLCIPLTGSLSQTIDDQQWVNLTELADVLEQPWVADTQANVWSFAEIPAKRANMMLNAQAPDFEVTDRAGNVVRMADLKGKKALIVTWSSW